MDSPPPQLPEAGSPPGDTTPRRLPSAPADICAKFGHDVGEERPTSPGATCGVCAATLEGPRALSCPLCELAFCQTCAATRRIAPSRSARPLPGPAQPLRQPELHTHPTCDGCQRELRMEDS